MKMYMGKPAASHVITEALKAAGPAGVDVRMLFRLAPIHGVRKFLSEDRRSGKVFSYQTAAPETDAGPATRHASIYFLDEAEMKASMALALAATAERDREMHRIRNAKRRALAREASPPAAPKPPKPPKPPKQPKPPKPPKPPKVAKPPKPAPPPKPPKAVKPPKPPKAPKPIKIEAPRKNYVPPERKIDARPVIIPEGLQIKRIPTPPGRFEVTGEERFFSSLAVGNYLRHDSAIARAYG